MHRLIRLTAVMLFACLGMLNTPSSAADMTFQLVNNTERSLNLKLFSNGESHEQWPSKTRAFSVKPDSAVQQIKISCQEGEQICWGAWMTVQEVSGAIGPGGHRDTRTYKINWGVGERGVRTCPRCCQVCTEGMLTRVMKLKEPQQINAR